jgi:hypothetical protein
VTQVSNIRMANGELIPDEWLDYYDGAPSAETDKRTPDGFVDRLIEEFFRKALHQSRGSPDLLTSG